MDKSLPYLVGNTYVPKAKKEGIVEKVDIANKIIVIKYNDETKEIVKLGLDMQRNSSFFFGNNIIPNVTVGQTVKKGDILAYEKDFFKKDILGNVRSCQGTLAKFVLHEKSTTDDDSLCITQGLAERMGTSVIMRKQITLPKKINLIKYNKVGDHVYKYDPLMVFEESEDDYTAELLANLGEVDESILAAAKQMPKSNSTGEIVDMKVYFSVPLEELSESLFKFVEEWSKTVKSKMKINKENGINSENMNILLKPTKPAQTGSTSRINGAIVPKDGGVLVEYFISHKTPMTVGDKSTSNANLKNIVAQVIPKGQEPITSDGVILDGVISIISVCARMCLSIFMNGVMSAALIEKSKSIAKEYLKSLE
jgi:DNA-directed RNA polymerase beta subunit